MSNLRVTSLRGRTAGSSPTLPDGAVVTGIVTATSFAGALTGDVTGNTSGTAGGLTGTPNISCGTIDGSTGTFTGDVDIADKIIHTGDTNTAIRFPAADTFTVETSGSEALRVDSSQNVLIGDTAGGVGKLSTLGTGNHISAIRHSSDTSSANVLFAKYRGSRSSPSTAADGDFLGDLAYYGYNGSTIIKGAGFAAVLNGTVDGSNMTTDLTFSTTSGNTNSEKLRITSGGEVQIQNGNLKLSTSGTGIDFSATNDPGGQTSELLDDYEEGTWTPTIGGNATYTNQVGTYVKVGRMVYAHWALTINAKGTGSTISAISGLPYPSGVATQLTSNLQWGGFGVSMAYALYYVGNNSTSMNLSYINTAATGLINNPNGWVNGATINGTIVYRSAY